MMNPKWSKKKSSEEEIRFNWKRNWWWIQGDQRKLFKKKKLKDFKKEIDDESKVIKENSSEKEVERH